MAAAWEELFDELTELENSAQRARLSALATTDPELARFLSRLLEADATATEQLARPLAEQAPRFTAEALAAGIARKPHDRSGERIGRWRLLSLLGRGGMAEVWLAERADGEFEQRAAVKLLRPDLGSASIHARFLRERRILARLEHPGIARLLDGGRSEQGEPYFVLEHVDGIPITTWCAEHAATLEQKLELMIEVCAAVEVAHRSLVVHRDLKPSNVLVDGAGRPRLLDFGIAKLLEPEAPQALDLATTARGSLVLTPAYAAPEQLVGEPATTATDVYTLGLLLGELLTGERPRSPSKTRLGGELDAVLSRALDPDPAGRYPAAAALAEDLRRFLDDRPLLARPATLAYRARCFARRHRWGVAAALVVALSLVGGLTAALWQAHRAGAQAQRAERVLGFLIEVFREADPSRTRGATITAREILATGAARIEHELGPEPEVQAELLDAIAQVERNLGLLDTAREHAERSLAVRVAQGEQRRSPATAASRLTLAEVLLELGELEAADTQLADLPTERALEATLRRRLSDLRIGLLWQRGQTAAALGEARRSLELAQTQPDGGEEEAKARLLLAGLLMDTSQVAEAVPLARTALELAEATPELSRVELALARRDVAEILSVAGELDASEELFASAVALLEETLGARHPEVGFTEIKRGFLLLQRRRDEEAERALLEAIEILTPFDHFEVGSALRYLGLTLLNRNRPVEAEQRFAEAEAIFRRKLEPDHVYLRTAQLSRAQALLRLDRLGEAEPLLREIAATCERLGAAEDYVLRTALKVLGETRRLRGDAEEALALHRRARAIELEVFGTVEHLAVATSNLQIALDLLALGQREALAEARTLVEEGIAFLQKSDPQSPRLAELLALREQIARALG